MGHLFTNVAILKYGRLALPSESLSRLINVRTKTIPNFNMEWGMGKGVPYIFDKDCLNCCAHEWGPLYSMYEISTLYIVIEYGSVLNFWDNFESCDKNFMDK